MGFELDEILYKGFLKFLKKRKLNDHDINQRKVVLNDIKHRLTIIARAISGKEIDVFPAEREGGYKNDNFFLPAEMSIFDTFELNNKYYLFRIVYLCVQKKMNLNWNQSNFDENSSSQKAIESAPAILKVIFQDYPDLFNVYNDLVINLSKKNKDESIDFSWIYGKWMRNDPEETKSAVLNNFDEKLNQSVPKNDIQTTINAKAVEEIQSLIIDKKQQEDYVLLHSFEKIETAEEFNGNWRDFDTKDELKDHQEALEEMNMKYTVRVDDTVHSVYQAEFIENTTVADCAEIDQLGFHVKYPEWDYKKRIYIENYCKVYPKTQIKKNSEYYQKTLLKYNSVLLNLRKILTSVNNKIQLQKRQIQGDNFDFDAYTDFFVDVHSKKTPDERVYFSKRKKEKDLAILLLLDLSLSSDGYANGNRVIDVEKEAAILFGEILNEFNVEFSIDGFSSKTRNNTTYITLKEFNESWNVAQAKIGAVEPAGYTRIGPALRHAGERIKQCDAKNKWIILLSDGKPNDYDKYEGQHGINDVKKALGELNENHINSYALTIEAQAKYYLPLMFGQNHYQILTSPNELIHSLAKLFEKIKHS